MASRVDLLVANLLQTTGDALYIVPGEKLFMTRGDVRAVVGREPVGVESFRAVVAELVPGSTPEELAASRHRMPWPTGPGKDAVEIRFGQMGAMPAVMLCRPDRMSASAVRRPRHGAPPASLVDVPEAPPSVGMLESAPPAPERIPVPPELAAPSAAFPGAPAPAPALAPRPAAPEEIPYPVGGAIEAPSLRAAAPAERPLDAILLRMLELKASDVHLSSGSRPVFRIHGEMEAQGEHEALSSDAVEKLLGPIFPEKNRTEFMERHDTDFAYEIPGAARFRVNVFRDRHGVGAVFRQIPIEILTAKQLNLPEAVVRLGDLSKGLVLVTGPTGSGKSTTLAALVDYVNETRTDHIITIEDPVEFVHRNKKCLVNQREIGSHTRSFKDALRAALREDPDIVLVGEMRDLETIAIAIETAETGHLVFGTLHTTTAMSTVDRIVDQFPADRQQQVRVMLADSLKGVVAQTLLRKVGGGRIAALEILLTNNAVANLIRDGKTFQLPSVLQTSKAQGMRLLNDSLLDLVKQGLVEPREAYLKAIDKGALLGAFRTNNIPLPTETAADPAAAAAPAAAPAPGGVKPVGAPPAGGAKPGAAPAPARRPTG
ncbi:MAG: type IV pilus twitching motility protein PilT [Thermoanaerobaculia bacterium]